MGTKATPTLAVPLLAYQIRAARRLHATLKQWRAADRALTQLAERFPDFGRDACLLKTVAINSLYGTNVLALTRMANHVARVMDRANIQAAGPELVERLAKLPPARGEKTRYRFVSFASKFAHFFIDRDHFPLCDSYVAAMLRHHLTGSAPTQMTVASYVQFTGDILTLRRLACLKCSTRALDHYLWLAGLYRHWLKETRKTEKEGKKPRINVEVRGLFENPGSAARDLRALLGEP